jgi:hypothetical protein
MNGHEPKNRHAQIFQLIETRGNSVQIAGRGKVARKNLINNAVSHPPRRGTRAQGGKILLRSAGERAECEAGCSGDLN